MAKKKKRHHARRNPPFGGIAKRVMGGFSIVDIGVATASALATKFSQKLVPAGMAAKIPSWALDVASSVVVGTAAILFLPAKYKNAAVIGAGVSTAVGLVSNLTGGKLGLESEMDLMGAGLGLEQLSGLGDGMGSPENPFELSGAFPRGAFN